MGSSGLKSPGGVADDRLGTGSRSAVWAMTTMGRNVPGIEEWLFAMLPCRLFNSGSSVGYNSSLPSSK